MTKLWTCLILCAMLAALASVACAADGSNGYYEREEQTEDAAPLPANTDKDTAAALWQDYIYRLREDNTAEIVEYIGMDTELSIPSQLDGYAVTAIGESAFAYCERLTAVTIPHGVTVISEYAFEHCSAMTHITIPDSVTDIGGYAFYWCSALKDVIIP